MKKIECIAWRMQFYVSVFHSFHLLCWLKYFQVYRMYMMTTSGYFCISQMFCEMWNSLSPNDARRRLLFLDSFDNNVARHSLIVTVTSRASAWKFSSRKKIQTLQVERCDDNPYDDARKMAGRMSIKRLQRRFWVSDQQDQKQGEGFRAKKQG